MKTVLFIIIYCFGVLLFFVEMEDKMLQPEDYFLVYLPWLKKLTKPAGKIPLACEDIGKPWAVVLSFSLTHPFLPLDLFSA